MNLDRYSSEELMAELQRRKAYSGNAEEDYTPHDEAIMNSSAAFTFSNLFDEYYPSEIEYVSAKSEIFDTYSEFDFPSFENTARIPSVLAIEQCHDADNAPWVDVADYYRFYLYDQNGKEIAGASTIVTQTLGDFEYELGQISKGFDLVEDDWSWFFQHEFFMGAPKDTEVFIFIESLKVAEEFQAVGIGKWMMGVMMRHLLGHITICGLDSDRIVVGVIPFPVDSDDDGFAEKEERLRDWYKHVFKCLETTESFSATKNFEYKDDKESETSSRVVYWSAGGKKKGKR